MRRCFFPRTSLVVIYVFILAFAGSYVFADYKDDIGYTALRNEFGSDVPDGHMLSLVTQAEAAVLLDHDEDDQTDSIEVWAPDPSNSEFAGKTIIDSSGSPAFYSGHATAVGSRFYGNTGSIAPGLQTIESFLANHWLDSGYLLGDRPLRPLITNSRVANHSWIGNAGASNSKLLRRLDWIIDADEYIQVVGPCRSEQALLGSAFNSIAVGQASGESGAGSIAVDTVYTAGRTCPQLIAPIKTASGSVPVIASGAALLIELGHTNPGLSTDPAVVSTTNRYGNTIYNAERSEVIKAVLMAGADRVTHNTVIIDGSVPNIVDYRTVPANRTENGLDRRYGAGQINIHHSYKMIAAGETNSKEDQTGSEGAIGRFGFDYDPFFGGSNGSNSTASYYFTADADFERLWTSVVWNISINAGEGAIFVGTAKVIDLDLILYDVSDPDTPQVVASSMSSSGSTENIWIQLKKNANYMLQVKPAPAQTGFQWDYALAWRIDNASDRDGDGMGDDWEVENAFNPLVSDSFQDDDHDGASNLKEYLMGTDPQNAQFVPGIIADTDSDNDTDGVDLEQCIVEFESCSAPQACTPLCDLDRDGNVDQIDIFLLTEDFGKAD